jgi:peptidyl-prolyl cis-trans isomerase D
LAKEHSEDPGTAQQGGSLDWFSRGEMYPEFEEAAFALKPNQMSEIVETQVGFHIIQALETEPSRMRPFEEVREELATEATRAQLFDRMPVLADQARAELLRNPRQGKEIADRLNLLYAKAAAAAPGDPLPGDLGSSPEVAQLIQETGKDGVTPVMQLAGGRLAVAVVNDVEPQGTKPLSEVRAEILTGLRNQKGAVLARQEADRFNARLDANGRDFLRTARETATKYIDTPLVDRTSTIEGVGTTLTFGETIFQLAAGAVHGPHSVGDRVYFVRIAEKKAADMTDLPAQREAILSTLRNERMIQRRELFEDGLVQNLRERGKLKVNEDVLNQLLTSFGG